MFYSQLLSRSEVESQTFFLRVHCLLYMVLNFACLLESCGRTFENKKIEHIPRNMIQYLGFSILKEVYR